MHHKALFILASLKRLGLKREASSIGEALNCWRNRKIRDDTMRLLLEGSILRIKARLGL